MKALSQQSDKDHVTVSWALIGETGRWCNNSKEIQKAIKNDLRVVLVSDCVIKFMNACDMLGYLEGAQPIFRFGKDEWKEMRKMGITHG